MPLEELKPLLVALEEDLDKIPRDHHMFGPAEDAVTLVKMEIAEKEGCPSG